VRHFENLWRAVLWLQWALDYESTMREFVHILLSLPLGGASFFTLKTISDSAEFFPNHVIVGINQHGVRHCKATASKGDVSVGQGPVWGMSL